MMMGLKEMFGDQNLAARQVAVRELMNTNMTGGTQVRNHILKIISHLNELEILGVETDGETQVDIIIQSLSESLTQFCVNYNMNKHPYSMIELLNKLQSVEGLIKPVARAYVAEKGSAPKLKGKKKQKKVQKMQAQGVVTKPKNKYFHYKKS